MKQHISAFAAGMLFGLGLAISKMINPEKVLAFLDIAGDWERLFEILCQPKS